MIRNSELVSSQRLAVFSFAIAALINYAAAAQSGGDQQLVERIKPVGVVCVGALKDCEKAQEEIEQTPEPAVTEVTAPTEENATPKTSDPTTVAKVAPTGRSGEEIYSSTCVACHAASVLGAPKPGDATAWQPRLAKGLDAVVANAINGLAPGMPSRGSCMDCSDAEIRAAIDYMTKGL